MNPGRTKWEKLWYWYTILGLSIFTLWQLLIFNWSGLVSLIPVWFIVLRLGKICFIF